MEYLCDDNRGEKSLYALIESEEEAIQDKTGEVSKGNI